MVRTVSVRLFWPALTLFVVILPVQHTIGLRYIAAAMLLLAAAGLLATERKLPSAPLAWPWILYGAVALLGLPYALDPDYSLREIRVEVLYCFAIFVLAVSAASVLLTIRSVAFIVTGANALYVLSALLLLRFGGSMGELYRLPPFAFAGVNSNLLVTTIPLIAYVVIMFWRENKRVPSLMIAVLLGLDVTALILGYNRQSMVALGVCILCAGTLVLVERFTWPRLAVLILAGALTTGLFTLQMNRRAPSIADADLVRTTVSQDPRWELWRHAIKGISDRPWTGHGFGRNTFSLLYPDIKMANINHWHAHNMILNKGVQMGIPGIMAFLFLWAALAREFAKHLKGVRPERSALAIVGLATLAGVFTKNMTDDFFVRDMAQLFWLLMGIYVGTLRSHHRNPEPQTA